MGTRSLTHVHSDDGSILTTIYRQWDGYPSGMGKELATWLTGLTVVNGIPCGDKRRLANTMGCLAAQLIKYLKGDEPGSVYVYPAGAKDCGEEYTYAIRHENGSLRLTCTDGDKVLYDGPPSGFVATCVEAAQGLEA